MNEKSKAKKALTIKQAECLSLLICGKTVREIGLALTLSHRTIEDHINTLKKFFDCTNKFELIQKCFMLGIAEVKDATAIINLINEAYIPITLQNENFINPSCNDS